MIDIKYVDKIAHIGDVHIRNVKRHTEYKLVFEKLYEDLRNNLTDDSLICLLGDIVHAKTDMSPELVDMVSSFFTELSKIAPVVLIPGNHDCNLNNSSRMDALDPIVRALNNDRIVYLKNSGHYDIGQIRFFHYGIFEEKNGWPALASDVNLQDENKLNIGLFHGPINNSMTDVGFLVTNKHVTPDVFKGCDLVLCGDIHKRQEVVPNFIVYCGSLIQQNHGESLDRHGYLLWDMQKCEYEERDIKNDYGYYTLDINDGVVPKVDDMPKNPRLRVRISNTPASKVKRVLTRIRKLYNVVNPTVTRMDTLSKIKTGSDQTLDLGDVSDLNYQFSLIEEYLKNNYDVDDDTIKQLKDINNDLNQRLPEEEIVRNINWKPVKFEFSNMFSYGEGNTINFESMKDLYGLFAANASGKSSLFDAISFCLFDKCSRTFKAQNIINNRKDQFTCKFTLDINGINYTIKRTGKRVRKNTAVKVDVEFYKEVNGVSINLNGEARRQTNEVIRQYIGEYEDFVLTALSLQNQNAIFIDKSQSERKDLLAQFMGINIFDKLYTLASEDIKEVQTLLKKMKNEDYDKGLADIENTLEETKEKYEVEKKNLSSLKQEYKKFDSKKIKLVKQLVDIDDTITNIDVLNQKKESIEETISEKIDEIKSLRKKESDIRNEIGIVENKIETLKRKDIEKKFVLHNKLERELSVIETSVSSLVSEMESKSEQLSHYDHIEYDPHCSYCSSNSKIFESKTHSIKEELEELENDLNNLLDKSNKLTEELEDLKDIPTSYLELKNLQDDSVKYSVDIAKTETSIAKVDSDIASYKSSRKETVQKIELYYKSEDIISKNNDLNIKIKDLDILLDNLSNKIDTSNDTILKLHGDITSLENEQGWYNKQIETLFELEMKYNTYEYYLDAVKRNGVPYDLIAKSIPVIEGEVNNILQQIVEFGMAIEIDGKNINAKIVYEDRSWPLEMCSGMERFISGLAIRVALINICNLPRPNFLVIDEGFGTLDHDNLTSIFFLFDYLKSQFDFLIVISHLDVMRDVVDNLIDIKKINGYSSINI